MVLARQIGSAQSFLNASLLVAEDGPFDRREDLRRLGAGFTGSISFIVVAVPVVTLRAWLEAGRPQATQWAAPDWVQRLPSESVSAAFH